MAVLTDRLMVVIDAQTGGLVTGLERAGRSSSEAALAEDRRAAATARSAAQDDKAAVSAERLSLAQAKLAGDSDAVTASQGRLVELQGRAAVSKASAASAADNLAANELRAAAATQGLGQSATGASGLLSKLGVSSETSAAALGAMGPVAVAAGAALEFKMVTAGIGQLQKLGGEVYVVQGLLGGTAQQASLLVGQMNQLGIAPDQAARSLQRLGAAIGDGSAKLGQFGIQVAHNADGTTDLYGTLDNLRKAYNGSADAATRDAIAKQLGLRNAQNLLPLLKMTDQQIQDLNNHTKASGGVLTANDVAHARQLEEASNQVHQAIQGIEISLARGVVPSVLSAEHAFAGMLPLVTKISELANKHVEGGLFGLSFLPITMGVKGVSDAWNQLTGSETRNRAAADAAKVSSAELAGSLGDLGGGADTAQTALDNLTSAVTRDLSAQDALAQAKFNIQDANQRLADDTQKLHDLQTTQGVDAAKVASAQQTLASASQSVTRAEMSEADAQNSLNKAREKASALDLADAQNKAALAGDKIPAAQAAALQAKEAFDALLGSGNASAGTLAAAQATLKEKQDEVTQAQIDAQKAQADLNTVRQKGTEQDPAVQSAEQQVARAHMDTVDALDRQREASNKLLEAERPAADFERQVRDLQEQIAKDRLSVKEAYDEQTVKALEYKDATGKLAAALIDEATAVGTLRSELAGLAKDGFSVGDLTALLAAANPATINAAAGSFAGATVGGTVTIGGARPSGTTTTGTTLPTRRALGGPLDPNQTYLVGDGRGPELLRMGRNAAGFATPVAGASGAQVTVEQHFHGYDHSLVAGVAAREAALSVHAALPVLIAPR